MAALFLAFADAPTAAEAVAPSRACEEGQRCGDRCIPWTEPCPDALRAAAATIEADRRAAALQAALCGPRPTEPRPPAPTDEEEILLLTAAGLACGVAGPGACDPDPTPLQQVVVERPACGEAPLATVPDCIPSRASAAPPADARCAPRPTGASVPSAAPPSR